MAIFKTGGGLSKAMTIEVSRPVPSFAILVAISAIGPLSLNIFIPSMPGLQREFGPRWSAEAYVVHYSHGQILGSGRNQGTDQGGIRIGYSFGD